MYTLYRSLCLSRHYIVLHLYEELHCMDFCTGCLLNSFTCLYVRSCTLNVTKYTSDVTRFTLHVTKYTSDHIIYSVSSTCRAS